MQLDVTIANKDLSTVYADAYEEIVLPIVKYAQL
jgi:hypothetical protein